MAQNDFKASLLNLLKLKMLWVLGATYSKEVLSPIQSENSLDAKEKVACSVQNRHLLVFSSKLFIWSFHDIEELI